MNNKIGKTVLTTMVAAAFAVSPAAATPVAINEIDQQAPIVKSISEAQPIQDARPIMDRDLQDIQDLQEDMDAPKYVSTIGTVQEINEHGTDGQNQMVTVVTKDGLITNFIVTETTRIVDEPEIGAEIIAYYDANRPVIMIYPPQLGAVVIANADSGFVLESNAEALLTDEARSDSERIAQQAGVDGDVSDDPYRVQITSLDNLEAKSWLVNGEVIDAPAAYTNEQGTVMMPLRAVAEALGYPLTWEAETRSVRVGIAIQLQIGQDAYLFGRMAPIQLGTAPEIVQGVTYVPADFFTAVMREVAVNIEADQIVIQQRG